MYQALVTWFGHDIMTRHIKAHHICWVLYVCRIWQSKGRWLVAAGPFAELVSAFWSFCCSAWLFEVFACNVALWELFSCRSSDQCLITSKQGQKQNWPGHGAIWGLRVSKWWLEKNDFVTCKMHDQQSSHLVHLCGDWGGRRGWPGLFSPFCWHCTSTASRFPMRPLQL